MSDLIHDPCPCGQRPAPYRFLLGWRPCLCGGHQTRYCRADAGGCGETELDPPRGEGCSEPPQGFGGGGQS